MTNYSFDQIISRDGTGDVKHAALMENFGRDDLLPLWVADMDFATPPFIIQALRQRLEHPILGYTVVPDEYWQAIIDWVRDHHGWQLKREWLSYIPGIVKGIGMVVNVFTSPGDKVIIQPPVYHPFRLVPENNGREIVWNPLKPNENQQEGEVPYSMDFENLERVCDERCRLLILSNPHNPGGICWDCETLTRLADFCSRRNILVVSDEIHCDMTLYGHRHTPFATVSKQAALCSITFQAPSKTFNMAGVVSSYCVIPDEAIRRRFFSWLEASEFAAPSLFAPIATVAAYRNGEEWRRQLIRYIEGNVNFIMDYCARHLPAIRPLRPQASFLVWLDCRGLNLTHEALIDVFVNKARLALNDGAMFGPGGEGFMRLNVGSPRSLLQEAMERLRHALS